MSFLDRIFPSLPHPALHPRFQSVVRWGIVVLVLLASAGAALILPPNFLIVLLALVPAAGGVLALLRWPSAGLVGIIIVSMLVPYYGPSGLNATMMLLSVLLGLWILKMLVQDQAIQLIASRTLLPLFGLIAVAVISFGVGQLPWYSFVQQAPLGAQLAGLSIFILSAGAYLLMAHELESVKWLEIFTWVFLGLGTIFIFGRVSPQIGQITERFFRSMGAVFWVWIIAMALSQAAFNGKLDTRVRFALFALVLLTMYYLFVQKFSDKSGWLPAWFCIGVVLSLRSSRFAVVLGFIGIVGLLATNLWIEVFTSENYSLSTRLDALFILVEIIKANPILGLGFANYYWYTPLFPIRGFAVRFNSHNNYVDIVAQTGLLGLAFFLWFFAEAGLMGWRLRNRVKEGFEEAFVYGAMGGLISMLLMAMLADWVLPFFYNIGLTGFTSSVFGWLFLGGLAYLDHVTPSEREESPAKGA